MRVSWNALSELVDLSPVGGPSGLAELLTRRGLEVEAIERQDQGLDKVVSAQILERCPHPQADRLSLCQVTIGSGEPLDIVCGAQNMKAGDKVVLAQIGAHLPNGLKITQSKIRGSLSNGMLCSAEELKLKEKSEGILILPADTPLGKPLAQILERDDVIFTLKLTANRGDCLSHWGLAREIASALGQKPKPPEVKALEWGKGQCPIRVELNAGVDATQFYGVWIEGVRVGPSPDWVVRRLEALGSRSINNVVDASNLVMLEMGHPLHSYDGARIQGGLIQVRRPKAGEELPLLDGETIQLEGSELVIADSNRAVGLAGIMGGGNSEVTASTTQLFLECAQFHPSIIRRAASRHQRHTEAAHRFERGVDPRGLENAISRLAALTLQLAGGAVRGTVVAKSAAPISQRKIIVDPSYFGKFLGMPLEPLQIEKILRGLDCQVEKRGASLWEITPPSYRLDLGIPEDLAEELARTLGYDAIPSTLPVLSSDPTFGLSSLPQMGIQDRARRTLVGAGLCEAVNFAFTSEAALSKLGLKSTARVLNPMSEEHAVLVPALLPGLVKNSLDNWNRHFGSEPLALRLFEMRPAFFPAADGIRARSETETGMQEKLRLAIALSGPRLAGGLRNEVGQTDFYDLKGVLEALMSGLGCSGVRFQPMGAGRGPQPAQGIQDLQGLFHPGQSVEILAGAQMAGYAGLLHPALAMTLKIESPLWIAEMDWDALSKVARPAKASVTYRAWSEFPPMERDFALLVRSDQNVDKITQIAMKSGKPLAKVAKIFDIYKGSQVVEGMTSVAVRVIFYDESRSLQEPEVEKASASILEAWKKELGAELRA